MHAANEVIMPVLGMIQDTGKIVRWLIKEGQSVKKGQPLLEVETDKAVVEIESPADGFLGNIQAQVGLEIPVGQVIAVILPSLDATSTTTQPSTQSVKPSLPLTASPLALRIAAQNNLSLETIRPDGGRVEKADVLAYLETHQSAKSEGENSQANKSRPLASPKARRLAYEAGVDLRNLKGTGPDGAVLASDLQQLLIHAKTDQSSPKPTPYTTQAENGRKGVPDYLSNVAPEIPVSNTWRVMVEHTTQAWTTAPHFYLSRDVDATALVDWHARLQAKSPGHYSVTDLLVQVVAAALHKSPRLNVTWTGGQIQVLVDINIGLAVASEQGLVVPVIHAANQLGLAGISTRRKEIVQRALQGNLKLEDIRGGTFTISNLGMYGIDSFQAVLNSPQAAILAVGRIAQRVVPVNGQPVVRPMISLTLTCDHRAVDGAKGAEFLKTLAELIEEPLGMLE